MIDGHHNVVFKCIAENSADVVEYASELHVNGTFLYKVVTSVPSHPI